MRKELVILLVLCSVFLAIGCTDTDDEDFEPLEEATPSQGIAEVTEVIESVPIGEVTPTEIEIISTEFETVNEDVVEEVNE